MNYKNHCLICLITILLASCANFSSNSQLNQLENTSNVEVIPSDQSIDTTRNTILSGYKIDNSCDSLLLEVINERSGMVLPRGKILDIRLLRDGRGEYDLLQNSNNTIRKEIQVDRMTLDDLSHRLKQIARESLEDHYAENTPCLDASYMKTIVFCSIKGSARRVISINECRPTVKESIKAAPQSLKKLMNQLDELLY